MAIVKLSEKQIESSILEYLNSLPDCFAFKHNNIGIYDPIRKIYRKPHSKFIIKGVSDIIGIYKGRPLFLEVKTPRTKNTATIFQKEFLKKIIDQGGIGAIVTSIEDVRNVLKEYN